MGLSHVLALVCRIFKSIRTVITGVGSFASVCVGVISVASQGHKASGRIAQVALVGFQMLFSVPRQKMLFIHCATNRFPALLTSHHGMDCLEMLLVSFIALELHATLRATDVGCSMLGRHVVPISSSTCQSCTTYVTNLGREARFLLAGCVMLNEVIFVGSLCDEALIASFTVIWNETVSLVHFYLVAS